MRQGPHPFRFFLLTLPYGAFYAYAAVGLQYVATNKFGVAPKDFAAVISAMFAVHGFKLFWAPVVDTTLRKRPWYLIGFALAVAGVIASSSIPLGPGTIPILIPVAMASQLGLTIMGMACENFLGALPHAEKGRASGWYQAGSFLGLGVGASLTIELFDRVPRPWMVAVALAIVLAPCALALMGMPEPERSKHTLLGAVVQLFVDLRDLVVTRVQGKWVLSAVGLTGLLIAFSPVGAGAAQNLFPSLAVDWHASKEIVEVVNGWVGSVPSAVGALCGGWLADRMNRRLAYATGGGLMALTAIGMAITPHTPFVYVVGTLTYGFFSGMVYAAFSAFVLETIGQGAIATKYNMFAGLSNLAISYMTRIDSQALGDHRIEHMLWTDAGFTIAGILGLVALVLAVRWLQPRPTAAVSST